jgi:hypothetical protein
MSENQHGSAESPKKDESKAIDSSKIIPWIIGITFLLILIFLGFVYSSKNRETRMGTNPENKIKTIKVKDEDFSNDGIYIINSDEQFMLILDNSMSFEVIEGRARIDHKVVRSEGKNIEGDKNYFLKNKKYTFYVEPIGGCSILIEKN